MKNKAPIRYMGAVLLIFLFAQAAPVVAQSDAIQALNETAASTSLAAKIDTTYVEDYNGDRLIDMQDVLWLIRNGMKAHADSVCDYNRDGRFSLMDVMVLLVNRPNRHVDALSLYAFWVICVATRVLAPV